MFKLDLDIPTYAEWKAYVDKLVKDQPEQAKKYQEQVLTFWKDFFNDIWIHTPSGKQKNHYKMATLKLIMALLMGMVIGTIIGFCIYHYFFMDKFSCCGVYGQV